MTATTTTTVRSRRRTHRLAVTLLAAGAVSGPACSTSTGAGTPATPSATATGATGATGAITVSAAASLKAPLEAIAADFMAANPGVTGITFTFDSSGTLAKQIVDDRAPVDVFASADEATMTKVTGAGLAPDATVLARNQLAIVVKKGNPKGITSLADLATRATVVSLCAADAPCGTYADQILGKASVTLPTDRVTRGQNAKATFTAVAEGDADAGIVYVTDITGTATEAVTIPADLNAIAVYSIAVLKDAADAATANAFVAYVTGTEGRAELLEAGFLPPT